MLKISFPRLPFREDKPFGILVLILLSVPLIFYWGTYEKYETIKVTLFLLLSGAALLAWIKNPDFSTKPKIKNFWYLFFGLFASFLFSVAFSLDWTASLLGSYLRFTNGLAFFSAWMIVLFLFVVQSQNSEKRNFFYKIIFFDAFAVAIVGILQSFGYGYYESLNASVLSRAPGLLGNPNFSAMFLAGAAGLAVPLFFSAKNLFSKIYFALGGVISVWGIILFSSRGAWLGFGILVLAALLLALIFKLQKKAALAFVALGVIGAVFWLLFYQLMPRQNLIASTVSLKEDNVSSRLLVWNLSGRAILERPVFGYGPGNFVLAYEELRGAELEVLGVFDDPHNLFLQQAVTLGIPFIAIFLTLLIWALIQGLKTIAVTKDLYLIASIAGMLSLLVMANFNPFASGNWLLLALFLGVLSGTSAVPAMSVEASACKKFKPFLFAVGLCLMLVGIMFFSGEILYYHGIKAFNSNNFSQSRTWLNLALKANPYQELGRMYLAASSIRLQENKTQIIEKIENVSELHPRRSAAYALESNLYYYWYVFDRQPEYLQTAVKKMESAIAMDPFFSRRYGRLGYYYLLKNEPEKAVEYLKLELGSEPAYVPGWLLLAKAYQAEGRQEAVVKCLARVQQLMPDSPDIKLLLSTAQEIKDIRHLIIPGGISPDILE